MFEKNYREGIALSCNQTHFRSLFSIYHLRARKLNGINKKNTQHKMAWILVSDVVSITEHGIFMVMPPISTFLTHLKNSKNSTREPGMAGIGSKFGFNIDTPATGMTSNPMKPNMAPLYGATEANVP